MQLLHITFQLLHNLTPSCLPPATSREQKKKKEAEMNFGVLVSFSEHSSREAQYLEDKKVVKMD